MTAEAASRRRDETRNWGSAGALDPSDMPREHDRRGGEPKARRNAKLGECGGPGSVRHVSRARPQKRRAEGETKRENGGVRRPWIRQTCLASTAAEAASRRRDETRKWGSAGAI